MVEKRSHADVHDASGQALRDLLWGAPDVLL